MTVYPSILKAAHVERGLRWTITISLFLHACLIAVILGKPPDRGQTIYFNPAYMVDLVGDGGAPGIPGLPEGGETGAGADAPPAAGTPTGKAEPLWQGPGGFTPQVKALEDRNLAPVPADTSGAMALPGATQAATRNAAPTKPGVGTGWKTPGAGTAAAPGAGTGGGGGGGGVGGTGYGLTPEQARFGRYYMTVFNKIQSAWVLPSYYEHEKTMAIVEITIRADGRIVSTRFEKKSGNAEFDRSVMRAIKKANPLPPLPAGINEPLLTLGIRFQ